MEDDFLLENLFADDTIPDELYNLVRDGVLSQLEIRLNEIPNPKEYLNSVRWYDGQALSLLMVAVHHGHESIVRFLLNLDCSSKHVELTGQFFISEDKTRLNGATALYCACYRNYFDIAKVLIDIGQANVEAHTTSHAGIPLIVLAIVHNRLDIVHFLIDNGYAKADDNKVYETNKWPLLFYAVNQNQPSLVEYLLDHGADVNHKVENYRSSDKTALLIAISRGYFETFHLLCSRGAHLALKDDKDKKFFDLALKSKSYSMIEFFLVEELIHPDDVEYVASSSAVDENRREVAQHVVTLLRLSLQHRRRVDLPKVCVESFSFYNYQRECETIEEFDQLLKDDQRLLIESILILERLFPVRKATNFHKLVEEFGIRLVQQGAYEQCLDLWLHSTELDQNHGGDYGMHLFVWYFCRILTAEYPIAVSRFLQAVFFIFKPAGISYGEKDVNNALFLVILAVKIVQQPKLTSEERLLIIQWVQQLCQLKTLVTSGKTLLHLCVDRRTSSNLTFRGTDTNPHISFPNAQSLYFLLSYGRQWLDVNSMDSDRNTPLHIHCQNQVDPKIVQILLHFGAHLDSINVKDRTIVDMVREKPTILSIVQPIVMPSKLKCLCAHLILKMNLNLTREILDETFSTTLKDFLLLHGTVN